jgi:RNA polymerase sigma factor (sigma-70 family)
MDAPCLNVSRVGDSDFVQRPGYLFTKAPVVEPPSGLERKQRLKSTYSSGKYDAEMARNSEVPPESFNEILAWLNPDREIAGTIYVQLRHDLAKIFVWNQCADPEGLTDEVMDRVARKVLHLRQTFEGDPRLFFYGVAKNLIKENPKKLKTHVSLDDADLPAIPAAEMDETAELREECLHSCLQSLTSEKRDLILAYYAKEKQARIDHRTEVAQRLGTSVETLRVRAHRIRANLEQCILRCLKNKAQGK